MLSLTLGCMYSGKTTALINQQTIGQRIVIDYDTLDEPIPYKSFLYSHENQEIECMKTNDLSKIDITIFDSILINEAQFFKNLLSFVKDAVEDGKHVYVYGLDGDFKQEVFGEIVSLIPMCDYYVKIYARCLCGNNASFSKRVTTNLEQYAPNDAYMPACRACLNYHRHV